MGRPWVIEAGTIFAAAGVISAGHVVIDDAKIVAVREGPAARADHRFPGGMVAPGFIDLQINGFGGVDFLSATSVSELAPAAEGLVRTGVTSFLPTICPAPTEIMRGAMGIMAAAQGDLRPHILGVHLEGPFLSTAYPGVHDSKHLRHPDLDTFDRLCAGFSGLVRLVTIAPELPGAERLIDHVRSKGIVISAGHTAADFDTARAMFNRGVSMVTHLFNAMRPLHHREPGIVGAALVDESVGASLILDGIHLHPAAAGIALRLLGPRRSVLVTDAVAAAGAEPGRYRLGDRVLYYDGRVPRLENGALAGSALALNRAVASAVALGWPLREAVEMATANPARVLGLPDKGRIAAGADADLVVLNRDLSVAMTICAGEVLYQAS